MYRDGLLQDHLWLQRPVGNPEDENHQQYVYVIEANGVSATLTFTKETLFGVWLPISWYEQQSTKVAQLRFQLE